MADQIWKLQRPLVSSDPNAMLLAYTKERPEDMFIPASQELVKELFAGAPKVYVYAHYDEAQDKLIITGRAEAQDW